ncbi:MAG: hypothetical protein MI743_12865 [Sneathiellales bacterium]|nr:hypothetical protein [Sneathiellales bacterium]
MEKHLHDNSEMVREAVGVFHDVGAIHDCVEDLQSQGFDRADITMLSRPQVVGDRTMLPIEDTLQTEDSPTALRGPVVEPESVGDAQGALLGVPIYILTLCGAGISAALGFSTSMLITTAGLAGVIGAIIGYLLLRTMQRRNEGYYLRQLEHGGIPLWVHVRDDDHERRAMEILMENNAEDVHLHDLEGIPYEIYDGRTTVYKIIH